ncbi:MAG: hypothetical protein ACJ74J_16350 [Blastocatellia bacterium]
MPKVLLLLVIILGLIVPVTAQNADEIAALRKYLGIPDGVSIAPAATPQLPSERPLTVFIYTGDKSAAAEVQKLVQEVNKKQAGMLEIVTESSKASVWLIHYEVPGTRRKDTDTSNSMDPALGRGQTNNVMKAEIRGYVVARNGNGLEILGRYKKDAILGDRRMELRDAFNKALKELSKSEKH